MLDTRGLVLGELAVRERFIAREKLDELVAHQERDGYAHPLGELMIERRLLSQEQLQSLLQRQKQAIADYERVLSVSGLFGRIAIERGFISEKQLAEAIRKQLTFEMRGESVRIGQILLRMEVLKPPQFWDILKAQGTFTCGSCGATLDRPRFDKAAIVCEKCGRTALSLD